jgi:hypothetical protein
MWTLNERPIIDGDQGAYFLFGKIHAKVFENNNFNDFSALT